MLRSDPKIQQQLAAITPSSHNLADVVAQIEKSLSPTELFYLLLEDPVFQYCCIATPKQQIRSSVIHDFLMNRKLWNVISDHLGLRLRLFFVQPMFSGGMENESLQLLSQCLRNFAVQSPEHQDLCGKMGEIFAASKSLDLSEAMRMTTGSTHVFAVQMKGHLVGAMWIRLANGNFKLVLSDHGGIRDNPLRSIEVPAAKLGEILTYFKNSHTMTSSAVNAFIEKAIPTLTGNQYTTFNFVERTNYSFGRCYLENYLPLIMLVMNAHLGEERGKLLFKKFKLFLWQSTLNEYKQHFAGRINHGRAAVIRACENVIADKLETMNMLENNLAPVKRRNKTFTEHCKDAYKKVFYTAKDSAKSRLISFFEWPNEHYQYDAISKKAVANSSMSKVINWATYIAGGFIYLPVKNLVKLVVEYVPYCLQKAAKMGIQNLRQRRAEQTNPGLLTNLVTGAGIVLLRAGYYIAKFVRVAARIITSPVTSARQGWKIHPLLGVVSAILSVAAIAALLFFTAPIFAYTNFMWASKLGLPAIAGFFKTVSNLFLTSVVMEGLLVGISALNLSQAAGYFYKGIRALCSSIYDKVVQRDRESQLETMKIELQVLTKPSQSGQDTLAMRKSLGAFDGAVVRGQVNDAVMVVSGEAGRVDVNPEVEAQAGSAPASARFGRLG